MPAKWRNPNEPAVNEMNKQVFRVLVVDDDASIRATYRHILQPPPSELGGLEALISGAAAATEFENLFQVSEADQGETAANLQRDALAQGLRFQLAFIDMRMPPGWDGLRTAVALRAQDPSIYLVIATAFSDYDVNELQRALGHDVVMLRKPFNQEEVFQLARTLCQSWETRQRLEEVTSEMERRVLLRTAELNQRNALQAVLVEIATRFVEAGAEDDINDAVQWCLARFGRAIDVDSCTLYQFDAGHDSYRLSHEWHPMGVQPVADSLRVIARADVAPAHARFLRGEGFGLRRELQSDAEMSPPRSLLSGHYERVLAVPMELGGSLVGFFGIGMLHDRAEWDPDMEKMLLAVGHTITRALDAHEGGRKLRESQAALVATQHAAHIGNWRLEAEGWRTECDAEVHRIFGISPELEVSQALLATLVFQEDWPKLQDMLRRVFEQGTPQNLEYRIRRADGEKRWLSCWAEPQRVQAGVTPCLVGMLQDITEHKQATQALRDSEARFRALVQNIPGMVYRCAMDAHWTIQFMSDYIENLSGYPLSDFVDNRIRSYASIIHPEDAGPVEQGVRAALARHAPYILDYRIRHADGSLRWVHERGQATFDADGHVLWLEGVISDINDRKRMETALSATAVFVSEPGGEQFCANLVDQAGRNLGLDYVHIARLQSGGRHVEIEAAWLNGKAIACSGYDLAGTPCFDVLNQSRQCIVTGVQAQYPQDKDLVSLSAESYIGEPIIDAQGEVRGLIVGITCKPQENSVMVQSNLRILAARAAAEWMQREVVRALRQERDNSLNLLQTVDVIILALDLAGRITLINRKGCQLLGWSEAELIGQDWFSLCLPADAESEKVRAIFTKTLLNDLAGSEYYENRVRTRSGEERLIAWHNSVVRDAQGEIIGSMSAGGDVTEQRQAEALLHASEQRFHQLFEDAEALSIQGYLADGTVVYWNMASERLYGYSAAEALGGNLFDLIIPDAMRDGVIEAVHQMFASGQGIPSGRLLLQRKNGDPVPVYSSHTVIQSPGQAPVLFCMDIDLSDLDRAEAALNIALTKYKTLFDTFPMGITVTDSDGNILENNATASQLVGVSPTEHVRRGIASPEWQIVRTDGSNMPMEEYASVRALKEKRRIEDVEMGIVKPDGITWISVTADLLPLPGYGVVVVYGDITARRQAEALIRQMAYVDALTGLPNRRLLMDRLGQAMAASERSGEYGALMMLDLDYFKDVNDSYGHDVGDQLLLEVAQRLLENVRQADTVARLGGDEYVVMLDGLGFEHAAAAEQAAMVAEKIRHALAQPYTLGSIELVNQCSASIGLALFNGMACPPDTLLKQADVALYQAKAEGRNRVRG